MQIKDSKRTFCISRFIWIGTLLAWILTEYIVMYIEIAVHLYRICSIEFYYRPLMVTLPLAVGFNAFRWLEKALVLKEWDDREHLSRGLSTVTLVSYFALMAALLELGRGWSH
jgi:hypothetical protein